MVYQGSKQTLIEFLHKVDNHEDSINITWEINAISNVFCDVEVFKGNRFHHHNILDTKLYVKPTDTHELLDKYSYHPKHVFSGIIKSQLIRYMKLCNNLSDFHQASSKLFKVLREKRHYSKRFLRQLKSDFLLKYHHVGEDLEPCGASMKCSNKRCEACLYIRETSVIEIYDQGYISEFPIHGGMTCSSKNVIYIIQCMKCKVPYVGQTRCSLKSRLQHHLSDIRNDKDTTIAEHFNYDCVSSNNLADLWIYPIEQIPDQGSAHKNLKKLLKRENYWIKELGTLYPNGLNKKTSKKQDIHVSMVYSKTANNAMKIMRTSYENLKAKFPKAFNSDLVLSYKRNKNISVYLVHAK